MRTRLTIATLFHGYKSMTNDIHPTNQPLRLIRVGDKVTWRFKPEIWTVIDVREHGLTIRRLGGKKGITFIDKDADYADVRKVGL